MFNLKISEGITRNVAILGFVSFLTDVSSEMILPLLPLFLVNVLGAEKSIVGLIEGVADSTASVLKVFSGWFSDRIKKRRPLVFFGYSLSTITKPLLAFATLWYHVLIVRFIDRVGKGVRTAPRDALIADSCDRDMRGKAFGYHRTMDTLGAVVGPLIAYSLLLSLGYRNIFLLSTIPGAISVLLILSVREAKIEKLDDQKPIKLGFRSFSREFKSSVFIMTFFALGNFSYAFFILRAQDFGIAPESIILLYLIFNIVYAAFSIPAGILSDRIGRKIVISVGYMLFGFMCLGFAFLKMPICAIFLFIIYGIFMGMIEGVQRAFVSDLTISKLRATGLGIFHTFIGIATFPASLAAGLLWQFFGADATFLYGSVIGFVASFAMILIVVKDKIL